MVVDLLVCCNDKELCIHSNCNEKDIIVRMYQTKVMLVVAIILPRTCLFDKREAVVIFQKTSLQFRCIKSKWTC